jgi:hypothetical protein
MRDIGAIVWVILVVVGVISSIVSNARKQAAGARPPQAPRQPPPQMPRPQVPRPSEQRPSPASQPAVSVASAPAPSRPKARPVRPPPPEVPAFPETHPQVHRRRRLLGDRASIVRGVIAAEILGKPLALRDGP